MVSDEARAEILHEHYNRTFENIQTHITKRERLLLALLSLVVIMLFQMAFPGDASQQIADLVAKKLDMQKPCNTAFIDSVLWFGMLCLIIRYGQTVVYVERQYDYIHGVENRLNQLLGKEDITREGRAYLAKHPCFSNWTCFLYTIGEKHQKGGQERGSCRGGKAPKRGPPHLTDVWCLEMVPEPKVRRDVDGGTL